MAVSSAEFSARIRDNITLIRKVRKLPLPGEVLVKKGQMVEPDDPVARLAVRPGIPWVIPAARLLGIEPEELPAAMLVKVGDRVRTQDVIARTERGLYGRKEITSPTDGTIEDISGRSGRVTIREEFRKEDPPVTFDLAFELGCKPEDLPKYMIRQVGQEVKKGQMIAKKGESQAFFTKTAVAPVSGVISHIDTKTGKVTISRPFKEVIVTAYIRGRVVDIIPERGCVVETPGVKVNGIFGLGRETHGELKVLTKGPDEILTPDMIPDDAAGKIIVGGSFATNEALARALEIGVKGVITGTVNYLNLTQSLGVKLGVGITGQEDVNITVILMEGFGQLSMRREVWELLKELEGYTVSMNGATQIRAGAIRPEVIVSFPEWDGEIKEAAVVDEDLKVGMRVRIVNEPYFGAIGTIQEIIKQPQVIETEARVPTVRVLLNSGESVIVPRPNVEIF
ncbi:MAG: hypothetical protein IMW97_04235 [Firmicutes bacterium]|nr:hypothetical protein [Candidatus Fermentithermobacillaceae bacterium]